MTAVRSGSESIPTQIRPAALRSQLQENNAAFGALVDTISDERWREKSPTCKWTLGEVLVHLTWAVEQLPREIASARQGKGMFNYPKAVADPLSYWITRWLARSASREDLKRRYDAAITETLRSLDDVPDSDWGLGASFYGERFYTVAELFETPVHHFAVHTLGMLPHDKRFTKLEEGDE